MLDDYLSGIHIEHLPLAHKAEVHGGGGVGWSGGGGFPATFPKTEPWAPALYS